MRVREVEQFSSTIINISLWRELMGLKDFFLNGGILGACRGFDHEKEGRPYGFGEFSEDAPKAIREINMARSALKSVENGITNLIDED